MGWYGFPRYVTLSEKLAKAERSLKQLKKKDPSITPLIVTGTKIVKTWWGKSWIENLKNYADYSNRLGRGRSYIKNGFILDFKIKEGEITSLVQGTRREPYEIRIKIEPLDNKTWDEIKKHCEGKIESLTELIEGEFPKDLAEIFTRKGQGLFPSPKEIKFGCSCLDWADMCKHVAASLYGVGVKLDTDPKLFFTLRKVEMNDLITEALQNKSKNMLKKANKKTSRVIDDSAASKIFDINIDEEIVREIKPISKKNNPRV
ncbi:zinc finger SWIM domain-containing protein [Candidatus Omnitrophus magneticus]|uniref:Zinc finger SWIM domain-containing protein n=1 Tax=Candidatus Omnitrophus magneticus TaxID=1609969 RepID=A0A0F0CKM0_9BACT|nr:zinc finger SWIM domain-containing protein [Candidatus Omnitrophus magneticus]